MTPPQHDKLGRIDANARHLLAVINDLLDIARIESGKMPVQIERIRLPELIDEVMTEVEPVIAGTRLAVDRNLSPDLPEIETDRQKVKQIVLNLLSNALKFTPEGSVAIRLEHQAGGGRDLDRRHRHRHRHRGGEPEDDLRGLRAGQQLVRPAPGRHRAGAVDLPPPRAHPRRPHHPRQPARRGVHIHPVSTRKPRTA